MSPLRLASALAVLAAACASPPAPTLPRPSPTRVERPAQPAEATPAAAKEKASASPRISVDLSPVLSSASVEVVITAEGPAEALAGAWSLRAPDPSAIKLHAARDGAGLLEVREERAAGRLVIRPARKPVGAVRIAYKAETRAPPLSLPWVLGDPDRLEVSGEALLLPDMLESARVAASIRVSLEAYGTQESGASVSGAATSFGIGGSRDAETTVGELRRAMVITGRMGTAVFDAFEGHDEAAWFGYTAFDPRPVAADVASFRTAAGEVFGEKNPVPQALLIVPDRRPIGAFVAARRARSVVLHVSPGEPWSGAVRIAVAACVLHAWIGERLWIGPEEPEREAEGAWFSEGFTRHLARDLLFRYGLLTPAEVEAEVNGLLGVLATSPRGREANAELAARQQEPGVMPVLVARGALYALRVDAALREKSRGKRSLVDVLRELYARAREKRGPLPTSAWVEAASAELGAGEREAFVSAIERGAPFDVDRGALGPCFRSEARRYEPFDLGFDEAASRAGQPPVIAGVRRGGPAERAGLVNGDSLIEATIAQGRSDVPVEITIERGGERRTIRYRPAGIAVTGRGFTRVKGVPDDACTK